MKNIIYFLFLIPSLLFSAYAKNVDSLKQKLHELSEDSIKMRVYGELSSFYMASDYGLTELYADSALQLALSIEDTIGINFSYNLLARMNIKQGKLDKAKYYYHQQKELYNHFNSSYYGINEASYYAGMGAIFYYQSEYDSSLYYFNKAIEKNQILDRSYVVSRMQSNVGAILYHQKEYDQALEYYRQAEETIVSETKDSLALITVLNNIGLIFRDLNNYDRAKAYFDEGLQLARSLKSTVNEEMLLLNLGDAYKMVDELDKALECYLKSLKIKKQNNIPFGINLERIGRVYLY